MTFPRVCTVGAGALSTERIYPNLGAAKMRLVGICDIDLQKAERNALLFGGTPYSSLDDMLVAEQPDGVIICVGPAGHAELSQRIMRSGYPVYTEKPPALTVKQGIEVAKVARETGLLCMTAFKKRYSAAFAYARNWLKQFPSEDWLSLSVDYCSARYPNKERSQTFLFDFAIHHLDLVHYLMGDVVEVFAFSRSQDAFAVSLRFDQGAVGTMNLNDGRSFEVPTEEIELTVQGGNALTISNSSSWRQTDAGVPSTWRKPSTFTSFGDSGLDTGHLAELLSFSAHLKDGTPTRSPIDESLKSLVLHDAITTSVESGTPVAVTYPNP